MTNFDGDDGGEDIKRSYFGVKRTIQCRRLISIGKSMICSDIWHKYHEWYFQNCHTKFHEPLGECNWDNLKYNITSGIYAKYHIQIMLLFVYTTTHKRFVIFTCRYFKLSWNTTALSQSNCRNFSCSSLIRGKHCRDHHIGK